MYIKDVYIYYFRRFHLPWRPVSTNSIVLCFIIHENIFYYTIIYIIHVLCAHYMFVCLYYAYVVNSFVFNIFFSGKFFFVYDIFIYFNNDDDEKSL